MKAPSKKHLKYSFVIFLLLMTILIIWVVIQIKPHKLTKTILESEQFKTSLIKRIKDLSGLNLNYSYMIADKNLNLEIKNIVLKGDDRFSPSCSINKLTGKILSSWKIADIDNVFLSDLNCTIPFPIPFGYPGTTILTPVQFVVT